MRSSMERPQDRRSQGLDPFALQALLEQATLISKFHYPWCRGVAQPGRAHGSGPWGRWFESSHPDHVFSSFLA
jgi:hypothetical protein